jgi:hypothetical protein
LGDYRDVIASIQAGYLGSWGEWTTAGETAAGEPLDSSNAPFLYSYDDRSDIIDRVLTSYAAAGVLQDVELRTPVFAKEVIDRNPSAYVGLHNDCFMTNDDDRGTYPTIRIGTRAHSYSRTPCAPAPTTPASRAPTSSRPRQWR